MAAVAALAAVAVYLLEKEGLVPVPIFINGVEAHTVVRDALTSAAEVAAGQAPPGAVPVDAVTALSTKTSRPVRVASLPSRAGLQCTASSPAAAYRCTCRSWGCSRATWSSWRPTAG